LCADNAAMIALVGTWMLRRDPTPDPELDAAASLEASGLPIQG
jgi:tRNA A37 threonylcarbamoyltransferase TsaD